MYTKNYIKMCEADNDLKWDDKSWKPKYGDYRPTQEELQEMVKSENVISLFMDLYRFVWGLNTLGEDISLEAKQYSCQFNSMNELWFAFVIKEKYNKVWNGKAWIEAEE